MNTDDVQRSLSHQTERLKISIERSAMLVASSVDKLTESLTHELKALRSRVEDLSESVDALAAEISKNDEGT